MLACIYIPPPFTSTVLRLLLTFLDGRLDVLLLVLGDFNCCLDQVTDRHPSPRPSTLSRSTPLTLFTCFSKTHGCLSRIDLEVGNLSMLPFVADVIHRPRSVLDHSPLVIQVLVAPPFTLPKAPWKCNAYWLKLFRSHEGIVRSMREFFDTQDQDSSRVEQWDAF